MPQAGHAATWGDIPEQQRAGAAGEPVTAPTIASLDSRTVFLVAAGVPAQSAALQV
ncbi:hypothetical protein [Streptomyces sp. NPDC005046]